MKKTILASLMLLITGLFLVSAGNAEAASRVKGYTKKNGTYVMPYYRSNSNSSKFDNYSTRGNFNPYTGKKGTVSPYKITPRRY